jgi:hypothetical protein
MDYVKAEHYRDGLPARIEGGSCTADFSLLLVGSLCSRNQLVKTWSPFKIISLVIDISGHNPSHTVKTMQTIPVHSLQRHVASWLTNDNADVTVAGGASSSQIAGHQVTFTNHFPAHNFSRQRK